MPIVTLTLDVDCEKPTWAQIKEDKNLYEPPAYRLILNNELLTERSWPPPEVFPNFGIRETMPVEIALRQENRIKFVPILENPAQAKFTLSNLCLNNKLIEFKYINDYELVFKL